MGTSTSRVNKYLKGDTLDYTQEAFHGWLQESSDLVLKQFTNPDHIKGYNSPPQKVLEEWFDEPLPEHGMDLSQLLKEVEKKIVSTATGNLGPHMYGYVMSGGNQVSILAEQISATINQNVAKWHLAPSITEIEKRVIEWIAGYIGFGENVGGFLWSSGSAANLDGITVARNIHFEHQRVRENGLFGMKPIIVYCSDETHNCIDKSVQMLGIGSKQLRKVPTNDTFQLRLDILEQQIIKDRSEGFDPFCVIGNAGTVNTGAIDDLAGIASIAKKYGLWYHIDGAYGGVVAGLDSIKDKYMGIESADSIALDFHKWLYQPFEVGCLLVKDWGILNRAYYRKADYLDNSLEDRKGRTDFNEHHFLLSRNAKALKVWMTIKAYGMGRIGAMIQKDIDLTHYLNEKIESSADFELVASSDLAISCFRYKGSMTDKQAIIGFNQKLIPALEQDGRVFITGTQLKGDFVIRACLTNHRKSKASIDYLLHVIREVAEGLS